jgi:hypothetical protein
MNGLKAVLLFVIPMVVLVAGSALLTSHALLGGKRGPGRNAPAGLCARWSAGKMSQLNLLLCGYGIAHVSRQWGGENDPVRRAAELAAERRFLCYDLLFPLFYGAALAIALWLVWSDLQRPFALFWPLAPVAFGVIADWIENLIHLNQLTHFQRGGEAALSPGWVQLASGATSLKLLLIGASFLLLAALSTWLLVRTMTARG